MNLEISELPSSSSSTPTISKTALQRHFGYYNVANARKSHPGLTDKQMYDSMYRKYNEDMFNEMYKANERVRERQQLARDERVENQILDSIRIVPGSGYVDGSKFGMSKIFFDFSGLSVHRKYMVGHPQVVMKLAKTIQKELENEKLDYFRPFEKYEKDGVEMYRSGKMTKVNSPRDIVNLLARFFSFNTITSERDIRDFDRNIIRDEYYDIVGVPDVDDEGDEGDEGEPESVMGGSTSGGGGGGGSSGGGGGGGEENIIISDFLKKQGIDLIINPNDELCGQRCLVLADASEIERKNLKKKERDAKWLQKAKLLCIEIEVKEERMLFTDFDKWADLRKKQVIILGQRWEEVYTTENFYPDNVYIYYDKEQEHYHYIHDINSATNDFKRNYSWCRSCHKSYLRKYIATHTCKASVCGFCRTDFVTKEECSSHFGQKKWVKCENCNANCPSPECKEKHLLRCKGDSKQCTACRKYIPNERVKEHKCGEKLCGACGEYIVGDHRCYIKPLAKKPKNNNEVWVFDFESQFTDDNFHVVNLAVADRLFSPAGVERVVFNTLPEFATWVMTKRDVTFVAHNGKAYDTWLLHKYIVASTNKRPSKMIMSGNKIMYMKIGSVRFVDSLNHIAQSLAGFPKMFGIKEMKKGYFPYLFNIESNQNYVGVTPDIKYYSPETMTEEKKKDFLDWHSKQTGVYNFKRELLEYCISDVDILKRAMEIYIQNSIDVNGINPIESSTVASYCMKVYRTNHMPSDKIAVLKKDEYDFCKRGFFGGRTEVFKMHKKFSETELSRGECGRYVDIQSLYPTVQFFDMLPIGIPEWKFQNNTSLQFFNDNFGYHEVDISPNKEILIPVLPEKKKGKLLFDVVDKEKTVYTSVEIIEAISCGYTVTKVHKSLVFDKCDSLFKSYIQKFLKIKTECSGYDGEIGGEEDYIRRYHENCGVTLEKDKLISNKGMKLLAKLCLNSLWGKFGQKDNMPTTKYVKPVEWFKLVRRHLNGEICIKNENLIDEDTLYVTYVEKREENTSLISTNVALAGMVTSQARMRLYSELKKLNDRVIYCDTDSVIYCYDPEKYNVTEGDLLGQWESETKSKIKEVIALAPKSYGYICEDDDENDLKCKGITLHSTNATKYTHESLRNLVLSTKPEDRIETETMEFKKNAKEGTIQTFYNVKKYVSANRSTMKRIFTEDGTASLPLNK